MRFTAEVPVPAQVAEVVRLLGKLGCHAWCRIDGDVIVVEVAELPPVDPAPAPATKPTTRPKAKRPQPDGRAACAHCGRLFANAHGVSVHVRRTGCGQSTAAPPSRKWPSQRAADAARSPGLAVVHQCRCGDTFSTRAELARHRSELDHYDDEDGAA